ncbi:MAG: AraC family transcriptional regulator [Sphingobacterium sp.]|jgi:AraC-like DNA-binding protein|nr:AraC family transcriptional regulator [Sphingobacterium sp.]
MKYLYQNAELQSPNLPLYTFKELQILFNKYSDVFYLKTSGGSYEYSPSVHDYFILMFFERGGGINNIGENEYEINKMEMHFYSPGQFHHWELERNTKVHKLLICREFFNVLFHQDFFTLLLQDPVIKLPYKVFNRLITELKGIKDELSRDLIRQQIIHYRIKILSIMIGTEVCTQKDEQKIFYPPALTKFLELVPYYFKENRTVKFFASKLGVSANYLNILCRKYLANTATQVINSVLLQEVKFQLINSMNPIKEIAMEYNFYEISLFSTFFKRNVGMSPSDYREKFKNEKYFLKDLGLKSGLK